MNEKQLLSIVIPAAPEREGTALEETVLFLKGFAGVEVICVDHQEAPTRSQRLQLGFERARGNMILFHHPRSRISADGIEYLLANCDQEMWGGFTHAFDQDHWLLKFTSWYSNRVRSKLIRVIYLDHCLFFHRGLYQEPIPAVSVFEDTLLCYNLRRRQKPRLLPYSSITSAVRFKKNGVYWQSFMNQLMKVGFYLGVPYDTLNKFYEKGLHLNSEYKR